MNSSSYSKSVVLIESSPTVTIIETWFIPCDILMITGTSLSIILSTLFLLIILLKKTCHTVPMMLTANSCLTAVPLGCVLLSFAIFTLENDLKQIQYQDSLCVFRVYISQVSCALYHYSILLQALYRYVTVVYPNRLFWQSVRVQGLAISLTWIFSIIHPFAYIFNNAITYNVDNQICQIPTQLSFPMIYSALCIYIIPVQVIMFIYFKLVRYVQQMSKRVTSVNIMNRARRELKMVQRIVILISMILTFGLPYTVFVFMSFFTSLPKYHFRIAYIFIDVSMALVMMALFQITDPLKASIMKMLNARPNMVAATAIS